MSLYMYKTFPVGSEVNISKQYGSPEVYLCTTEFGPLLENWQLNCKMPQ